MPHEKVFKLAHSMRNGNETTLRYNILRNQIITDKEWHEYKLVQSL